MANYVLVHGAWHSSWAWKRVRSLLTAKGHQVFTPTLTGPGDRAHLLTVDVSLETHIADVVNLLIYEELRDVVLVRASRGGVVVRHVADRLPDRIRSLVYLDAFVPEDGKSLFDYAPESRTMFRELAAARGEGWKVPPIPAAVLGVNAADVAWADRQCTMHPLLNFEAPARISGACDDVASIGYIYATGFADSPFWQFYAVAGERGWGREELACGHCVMLDMPEELTAPLLERT